MGRQHLQEAEACRKAGNPRASLAAYRKAAALEPGLVERLLERFKLDHMRDEYAGTMSGGQRKLLEMARSLMAGAM